MPCRVDICGRCNEYNCKCGEPDFEKWFAFDHEGAMCDVLTMIENEDPTLLRKVDPKTIEWWRRHESTEKDRIKAEALAKLTPRERRALGLK